VAIPTEHRAALLEYPLGPGVLRACPACGRWFALKFESERPVDLAGMLRTYRCKHCGVATTYADRHSPDAI
jgi:hypothetical protein